jgi:hypothetical protein
MQSLIAHRAVACHVTRSSALFLRVATNDIACETSYLVAAVSAKFSAPAGTKPQLATQLFNERLAETEGRIAAILAERKGNGVALTPQWFVARHPVSDRKAWEDVRDKVRDQVQEALQEAAGDDKWHRKNPMTSGGKTQSLEKRCAPFWWTGERRRNSLPSRGKPSTSKRGGASSIGCTMIFQRH